MLTVGSFASEAPGETRESNASYRAIFRNAPILFAISSVEEGRFIDVNDAFLETVGFTRDEVLGRTSSELNLWQDPGERARLLSYLRDSGSFRNEEVTIRKKNGEFFSVLFSGAVVIAGNEQLLFTVATEAPAYRKEESGGNTEVSREDQGQERLREELNEARQMLIDRNRQSMMGQMIGNIAHQWQQPLNAVGLLIQNMTFDHDEGEEVMKQDLDKAMQLILYMAETAEVFRSFLKPGERQTEFSINEAVGRSLLLFDAMHSGGTISVDYRKPGEPVLTSGNGTEFCQALLNVLNNAHDVLTERMVPDPRIWLEVATREDHVAVMVTDNGGGIAEENLQRLFDRHFTTRAQDGGTGIGLAIARAIIEERMGGKIAACNTPDGARFTFTLRRAFPFGAATVE